MSEKAIPHGTLGGYTNHSCRCDDCRAASTAYMGPYMKQYRQPATDSPTRYADCTTCGKTSVRVTRGVFGDHNEVRVNRDGQYQSDVRCAGSGTPAGIATCAASDCDETFTPSRPGHRYHHPHCSGRQLRAQRREAA